MSENNAEMPEIFYTIFRQLLYIHRYTQ